MKTKTIINGHEIAGRMPLFQEWGRLAIRAGEKTQTRRIPKLQIPIDAEGPLERAMAPGIGATLGEFAFRYPDGGIHIVKTMKVGDIRVMTEPLKQSNEGMYGVALYADDGRIAWSWGGELSIPWRWKRGLLTSVHMPHEAARTLCEITGARIELLQDISEEDALAEGCEVSYGLVSGPIDPPEYDGHSAVVDFGYLWDEINKYRGYPWSSNPWVIVYDFKVIS